MRTITVRNMQINVPATAAEWMLYSNPAAHVAADDLNNMVDTLVQQWVAACHDGEMAPTLYGCGAAWRRLVNPVLLRYQHAGTLDSDVVERVNDVITQIASALSGV